jgi:hypothetical protein
MLIDAGGKQTGDTPENRPGASFPPKRESILSRSGVAPRVREGDSRLRSRLRSQFFLHFDVEKLLPVPTTV